MISTNPQLGAATVFSGPQVVAAQALASGQVVVALSGGDVSLLSPQGNQLAVTSVLAAQVGLPALPSAIDVVAKPDGQLNVLVSSEGSDTIFVFAQVASSEESGGGGIVTNPALPVLSSFEPPTLSAASQSFTLAASAVVTSASATAATTTASVSASSSSVSVNTTTSVGLSLGNFSSLGNRSSGGIGGTVLVPVEGNTYLSVPILDFGSANDEEAAAGARRMPSLSGMYPFGDTSPLTRFVIGLDEALRGYRGDAEAPLSRGAGRSSDPWNEDLFFPHLLVPPTTIVPGQGDPKAMGPDLPQTTRPVGRAARRTDPASFVEHRRFPPSESARDSSRWPACWPRRGCGR